MRWRTELEIPNFANNYFGIFVGKVWFEYFIQFSIICIVVGLDSLFMLIVILPTWCGTHVGATLDWLGTINAFNRG